jgi:hypothetical protein
MYARVFNSVAVTATDDAYARFSPEVKALWAKVPDQVRDGWRKVNGTWTAPPAAPSPVEYYIAKVTFERRFDDLAFAVLDGVRITIRNRPSDWSTNTDPNWQGLRAYVRALSDYDAADRINVLDPSIGELLAGLQSERQLFGEDPDVAAAKIALVLTPAQLAGEPTP